jgi:hypothetical protein
MLSAVLDVPIIDIDVPLPVVLSTVYHNSRLGSERRDTSFLHNVRQYLSRGCSGDFLKLLKVLARLVTG